MEINDIDTVHEVDMYDGSTYWLDEEEYKILRTRMIEIENEMDVIEFTALEGVEVTCFARSILAIDKSTRKQRDMCRENNKKYRAAEVDVKKKEAWEE